MVPGALNRHSQMLDDRSEVETLLAGAGGAVGEGNGPVAR